jgi:HlyD family secretion protein
VRNFVVGIFALILLCGCGSKKGLTDLQFSGTMEMTEHQLGAKAAGRITTLAVEEGRPVKAGQVLATLDRYEQAKKDYERAESLYKQGGADRQTVEYARLNMEDQQIIAPIDAVVLVKVHETGEVVSPGAAVVVLGDPKDQWVKVFIPEGVINQLKINQQAQLSFDGLQNTYQGHVFYIAPKAEFTPRNVQTPEDRVTQAFAVKIALDNNPDGQAHPGVAVDVKFKND